MLETIQTTHIIPYQDIKTGNSTDGYVDKLIYFLEEHYASFPTAYAISVDDSEEAISEKLYLHLQRKSTQTDAQFQFQPETPQKLISIKGHKKRADFGVNLNTFDNNMELIYCIEAKRLPTDKIGKKREKEYVFGNGGGIQRFKDNYHGISRNGKSLLERNGMVGYVQQNDFDHWYEKINEWITDEPTWSNTEILQKINFGTIAKLESSHERISKDNLKLTHFWINLC
jgi:hypothetical protein